MTEREELEMWKKMYMRLLRGTEEAIDILIKSEEATENLYIEAGLTKEAYAVDTVNTKKWIPIMAVGEPTQISYARPFRISQEETAQMAAAHQYGKADGDTN